jgi:very-short-patch-repair endonuclease
VRATTGTTYADVLYAAFGVLVELDGRQHTEIDARRRDSARDNESAVRGFAVLRYDWAAVTFNPCRVAAEVAAVLRSRGWTGTLTTCARCRDAR